MMKVSMPIVLIFLDARRNGLRIAHQRRACTATDKTDTGPQIGADLELVAAPP